MFLNTSTLFHYRQIPLNSLQRVEKQNSTPSPWRFTIKSFAFSEWTVSQFLPHPPDLPADRGGVAGGKHTSGPIKSERSAMPAQRKISHYRSWRCSNFRFTVTLRCYKPHDKQKEKKKCANTREKIGGIHRRTTPQQKQYYLWPLSTVADKCGNSCFHADANRRQLVW